MKHQQENIDSWRFCIAPMMKYTDRNYRYFARLLSKRARLYTEMVVASAITKGDRERFLCHAADESPVALQLGGSDPKELAEAAMIGEQYGFNEINLNVGCPSDRVQSGRFGACLMAYPELVSECVAAIKQRVNVPVTVKTRIGIDDNDAYSFLHNFITHIVGAEVDALIIHARKALLNGLSPLQNRTIPPLRYNVVYRASVDFPALPIIINGGIENLQQCQDHLQHCQGVMLGRVACTDPYLLSVVDETLFETAVEMPPPRDTVLRRYLAYLSEHWTLGGSKQMFIKPLYGLYHGEPGAKQWRRNLNEAIHRAHPPTIEQLLTCASALQASS